MNNIIEVEVIASSGAFGISTLTHSVEYTGDPEEFQKKTMQRTLQCGYTAILHYKGSVRLAMCCYKQNKELAAKILEQVAKQQRSQYMVDGLRALAKTEDKDEQVKIIAAYQERNIDLGWNTYYNKWMVQGGWDEDGLCAEIRRIDNWLRGVYDTLQCLGFDPDDCERKKRICTNLGMYRV